MTTDYETQSKEDLISKIESLTRLNNELLDTYQQAEKMEFGWTGNLGQWFWDLPTNDVTFNPLKAEALGYMKEELPEKVPFQFFTEKLHPDDYEEVMQRMRDHLAGKIPVWEVKYRIQAKDGSWKVYQDRGRVTQRDEKGNPLFLTGIVFDITEEAQEREQLKVKNRNLRTQVKQDPLTSLHSRTALLMELAKQTTNAKKQDQPFSLLILSVDKYPQYEEELGIVMAEEIIKETGRVVENIVQDAHVAGRYREAIFYVLMEDTSEEEAYEIAENIRETVLGTLYAVPRSITISAGVSAYIPEETISELVQNATQKLAAAQRHGGNRTIM
ncbi:GGDEF domain-containing protein [Atopococcus tabaci]|uniref:GGDEF domain-containing protein n=1 Tax=Atopococcus tabaci TaxID=269774 RepID=UPI002409415D|nr:sensor domain-containing diguanylate cyclase [Atopococcus tabaci]